MRDLALREVQAMVITQANLTAGINSRECIGQYARPYPTILVSGGGGYERQRVCIWVDINITIYI